MKRYLTWLAVASILLYGHAVHAAGAAVDILGPITIVRSDEIIPVDITITSAGKNVNSADLSFSFPPDIVQVDRIQREQTVFDLWPEEPSWDNVAGTIHLVGGHPNGLVMINARVATIYFRALQPGAVKVALAGAQSGLYLNDGVGTKLFLDSTSTTFTIHDSLYPGIPLSSTTHATPETWSTKPTVNVSWPVESGQEYSYIFSADSRTVPDDIPEKDIGNVTYTDVVDGRYFFTIKRRPTGGAWSELTQRRFLVDTVAPEPFQIIHPDPATIGGQNVITWSSSDVMSGILESRLTVNGRDSGVVTSPLLLKSDWGGKTLTITVTDQAGNHRSASWHDGAVQNSISRWLSLGVAALLIIITGLYFIIRQRKK